MERIFDISGNNLYSRDGYYEAHTRFNSERVDVIIPEEIFYEFRIKNGLSMRELKFRVGVDLVGYDEVSQRYRKKWKKSGLVGVVDSLDKVSVI